MIGQGVLRECLLSPEVARVISVVRTSTGQHHQKLHEIVHQDFLDFRSIEPQLSRLNACFFCLGVSSSGMTEEQYTHVTYGIAIAAAQSLLRASPEITFVYVSGAGTDSTEHGRTMWARIKGRTENALLRAGFPASYMFRPGFIQPLHGIKSKTRLYRIFYAWSAPMLPLLRAAFPRSIVTTEQLGRAMLSVARDGYVKPVLEARDLSTF
ncbi:Oxidoreductase [Acidisarcina polymorpha]|uniref:Oxidoreductase n=2 Tax=Acidisarcina polymorpha TaxID=2211140 RepID=A0A2Z5FY64_9BACT|nr:Oxidoreductase [Acidisarcina polymorpha]